MANTRAAKKAVSSQDETSVRAAKKAAAPPPPPPSPPPAVSSQDEEEEADFYDDDGEQEDEEGEEEEEPVHKEQRPPPQEKEVEAPVPPQKQARKMAKRTAPVQRVWSTDDDIRILEALVAHRKEDGSLPKREALFDILAGKLDNPDYDSKELESKVRNLRTRYGDLCKRGEVPKKQHDRRILDLSKLLYAPEGSKKAATAAASNGQESKGFEEMCELYPYFAEEVKRLEAVYPGVCKRQFGTMEDGKARAMDNKFKRLRVDQMKLDMRRAGLTKQATKTFVDMVDE